MRMMKRMRRVLALSLAVLTAVPQNAAWAGVQIGTACEVQADGSLVQVGNIAGEWIQKPDGYYWMQEDGSIYRKGGWFTVDGKKYFLAYTSGRRKTGWVTYKERRYYMDPQTGELQTGWQDIDGKRYYFDAKTGALHKGGWLTRGKNKYYIKKDGTATIGYVSVKGKKYYMKPKYGIMLKGWMTSGSKKYYFGTDGARASGFTALSGKTYYFDTKWGYAVTGWKTIGNSKYYFGSDGVMRTGLQTISGKNYIFDTKGAMITSKAVYKQGSAYYRIASSGAATAFTRKVDILACQRLEALGWSLPAVFNWAASRPYRKTPQTIPYGYSQAQYFGEYGLENGFGDCYVMACIFYSCAHILGYQVRFMKGYVPSRSGAVSTHGWVEINYNGTWRVCDPNFTYNAGRSGYMIYYGMSGTWRYINYGMADKNY